MDRTRKIHVEIKPATIPQDGTKVIAASVDDIKASLSGLALSPPRMRRDNSSETFILLLEIVCNIVSERSELKKVIPYLHFLQV